MLHTIRAKVRPVHAIMFLVFFTGMLLAGAKFLDAKEVGLVITRMHWWFVPPLLCLPLAYLWLKAERFADMFELTGSDVSDPRIRCLIMISYVSAQLATLLPGGYVARIGLIEAALQRGTKAVLPTLLEKVLDLVLLMLVGLYACSLFPQTAQISSILLACLSVVALFAFSKNLRGKLRSGIIALFSKMGGENTVREALQASHPDAKTWIRLSVQTVAVLLSELTILWASFAALGLHVSPIAVLLAYAGSDVIGRVAPTPGGVGFTEAGMVAILHQFDGMELNHAAAATFVFRILLFLIPALYGGLSYLFLWTPMTRKQS